VRAAQTHEDVFAANPSWFEEDQTDAGSVPEIGNEPRRRSGVRTPVSRGRSRGTRPVVTVRKLTREQEYSFIKADLRRLLVTAGSLGAVMIVLLFVLEM
jgi:hypothetical protein